MNIRECFPSAYINSATLGGFGAKHTLEIDRVELEEVAKDSPKKVVVYFKGRDAGLPLNKTNATSLDSLLGEETDNWGGKSIELRVEKVNHQGGMVDGIRVGPAPVQSQASKPQASKPQASQPAPATAGRTEWAEDDDVPF